MEKLNTNQLNAIPETMLIPLWAKATENKRSDAILKDAKAIEIINKIDYDFDKFKNIKFSQIGVCIRAKIIDDEVKKFLTKHPNAVVIQLGAGLDARYERLGCPKTITHWYDLDLPEVISIRKEVLSESSKNSYLSISLFDFQWIEEVKKHKKRVLILCEGVLMYFSPEEVRVLFETICQQLGEATFIFDMLAYKLLGQAKKHDAVKVTKNKAEFKWTLLNTKEMEQWNTKIHLKSEYFMSDFYQNRFPFIYRMLCKIPYIYKNYNQRIVCLEIR
ncbi:MAG: class I SAM-dependent methyltransferase [Capnocytophaga sp.]|nr:class I SAM-dependent methyltransferase [Capnocytophaga sp.]